MSNKSKILIVEHDPNDIELMLFELKKSGINYESIIVQNEPDFRAELIKFNPDIILSDYSFPSFDGPTAFKIKEKVNPDIPFIFVSGTVGEERAVELIKNGVTDYVLKDKLFTLSQKIFRALKDAEKKKEKIVADEKLYKVNNLYSFISEVNQNIVRAKDEATLFRTSCSLAIEFGKFKISWIGLFDIENQKISLIEQCGIADRDLEIFRNKVYKAGGAQGQVLQSGKYFICNDIQTELESPNWKSFGLEHGIRSYIVLPIKKSNKIIGTFNLYSTERNFSGIEEIKLLVEVTDDISFALNLFEKEKKQKETDKQIAKNEKQKEFDKNNLSALINNTKDLMWSVDRDFNLITSNKSFDEMIKMNFGKVIEKGENVLSALASPEMLNHFKQLYERAFAGEAFIETDYFNISVEFWSEISFSPINKGDTIIGAACHSRDITERKRAEEQLRKSEAFNRGILNSLSSHIAVIDVSGTIIAVNESWKRFAIENGETTLVNTGEGANYYEVCEKSAKMYVAGAFEVLQGLKDVMNGNKSSFYLEYACHSPNEQRWFGMRVMKFDSAEPMVVTAHQNITERKLAEENLIQSESKLNEAQAIGHLGNWELDFDTQEALWSAEACRIYGISPVERKHTFAEWESFIHPDDLDSVRVTNNEARKTLNDIILNHRIVLKDGSTKHIYAKSKFKLNQYGKPVGLYGIILDVTERRSAEEERDKMISNIVRHSKNLEQFTSIVSHNLRAPVANILGLATVLKNKISKADRVRSQEYLFQATEQLDKVFKDLNTILRVRSEINEYKETVYFAELVDTIKSSIYNIIETEKVEIVTDFRASDKITSIKSYMHSIFYNLISNSIKYRQPGKSPVIRIKSEVSKEKIKISFKDNGIGVDLIKHGDKIFGLYKRFHLHIEGKGLGLFMVKTQIETLGGTIRMESEEGKGAEFIIELPL